jgi:hypothetical protein
MNREKGMEMNEMLQYSTKEKKRNKITNKAGQSRKRTNKKQVQECQMITKSSMICFNAFVLRWIVPASCGFTINLISSEISKSTCEF